MKEFGSTLSKHAVMYIHYWYVQISKSNVNTEFVILFAAFDLQGKTTRGQICFVTLNSRDLVFLTTWGFMFEGQMCLKVFLQRKSPIFFPLTKILHFSWDLYHQNLESALRITKSFALEYIFVMYRFYFILFFSGESIPNMHCNSLVKCCLLIYKSGAFQISRRFRKDVPYVDSGWQGSSLGFETERIILSIMIGKCIQNLTDDLFAFNNPHFSQERAPFKHGPLVKCFWWVKYHVWRDCSRTSHLHLRHGRNHCIHWCQQVKTFLFSTLHV